MKKVAVLMSTYNGAKYLSDQINSVLNQTEVDIMLYIRDDGSTDSTINELKKFNNDHIKLVQGNNVGASRSFIELVHLVPCTFDYYAFCDQDDIWEENKIVEAIRLLNPFDKNTPNLYYSAQKYVDEHLNYMYSTSEEKERDFSFSLTRSLFPGCTMVFNLPTFKCLQSYHTYHQIMHDQLVYQVVSGLDGNIVYDKNSYLNYRIHGNNVSNYKNIKRRLSKLYNDFFNDANTRLISLIELENGYGKLFTKNNQEILSKITHYQSLPFIKRIILGLSANDSLKYKIMCSLSMALKKF